MNILENLREHYDALKGGMGTGGKGNLRFRYNEEERTHFPRHI